MSLDSRYVAQTEVPKISDAFLRNASWASVQDARESPNRKPLIKTENLDLTFMVYYFTKALENALADRIRDDFTGACDFGRACAISLTHNSLVLVRPFDLTESGLPVVSQNKAATIRRHITRNSKGNLRLPSYFMDLEIPKLSKLNPGLKYICVDLPSQRDLSPKRSFLTESLSGAVMAYELLAKQKKVYQLEDQMRL